MCTDILSSSVHTTVYYNIHSRKRLAHRTAKQLRERWHNHLDPVINKGPWTEHEDKLLIVAQNMLGNRFADIAKLVLHRKSLKNAHAVSR